MLATVPWDITITLVRATRATWLVIQLAQEELLQIVEEHVQLDGGTMQEPVMLATPPVN